MSNEQKPVRRSPANFFVIIFTLLAVVLTFALGYGLGSVKGRSNINEDQQRNSRFATFESVFNVMTNDFYYGNNSQEYKAKLMEDAINGMVDAQGDIHTDYMDPEEVASFTGSLESSFVGIGVRYTDLEGDVFVIEVLEGSPAEKAGILAGDLITHVDGKPCKDFKTSDELVNAIRGEKGTEVVLTVVRNNEEMKVTAIRNEVENSVFVRTKDDVAVIQITSFGTGTAPELKKKLDKIEESGIRRLIIDLRGNGGGYQTTLDDMCSYFMKNGEIVMREVDRDGNEVVDVVRNSDPFPYEKIVILINSNSASCSEVFTLALTEHCGAVTVGTKSYGKGLAQLQRFFPDGSAIKYTDVIWKSDKGVFVQGDGIKPDYEVWLPDALYLSTAPLETDAYQYDQVGAGVSDAQLMLEFLGYDVDRTDGYFSQDTVNKLKQFQHDNNLEETGILSKDDFVALQSALQFKWSTDRDSYDTQLHKALEVVRQ